VSDSPEFFDGADGGFIEGLEYLLFAFGFDLLARE